MVKEQQAALRVFQEFEHLTARFLTATEELDQARQTVRLLKQGQVGSGTPSFTPTLTPQHRGCASQLTVGQLMAALPTSRSRAPWATTRETLQQETASPSTPLPQPCCLCSASSGLLSLCLSLSLSRLLRSWCSLSCLRFTSFSYTTCMFTPTHKSLCLLF